MRYLLTTVLFCIYSFALSQTNPIISAPSDWIQPSSFPEESDVSKYDVKSGYYFKLIDYQIDMARSEYYSHYVYNVLSSGGISNVSQLQISYDSSYQELVVHQFRIHRKGQVLDRTDELTLDYIKNEEQLEANIYHGQVTALAVLPDIRKDDLVEVSYSIIGSNPVFESNKYYLVPLDDINPIDRFSLRIRLGDEEEYDYVLSDPSMKLLTQKQNEAIVLSMVRENIEAFEIEETTPPWIIPFDYFEISNSKSWSEINKWALKLFEDKADDKIKGVLDELFDEEEKQTTKINTIIDFVQDEIRYMGIETGIGSIVPFSPNQVLEQRFGDCKDKALLMCSMLEEIGVSAYPALVNSSLLGEVSSRKKSAYLFDHVIVKIEYGGNSYWVDPTFSYQGGDFTNISTFDYEKALVVKEGTVELEALSVEDNVSGSKVIERFDVSSYDEPGKLKVETTSRGLKADQTRSILEYYSLKELADFYKSYYARAFPTIDEEQRMKIRDDMEANELNSTEFYSIPGIWKEDQEGYEGKRVINYHPVNLYTYLYSVSCEKKNFPVYYLYPAKFEQEVYFTFAEEINIDFDKKTFENVAFRFTKEAELIAPKKVKLTYHFESKTKEISPSDYGEVCREIDEIVESLPMTFYFSKNRFSLSDLNMDYQKIQLKTDGEELQHDYFYFDSVVDNTKSEKGIIGISINGKKQITAYVLDNGLEKAFESYLQKRMLQSEKNAPLKLIVNGLLLTEKVGEDKTSVAKLDYDYSVTLEENGTEYGFRWKETIESSGKDMSALHEKNIRASLANFLDKIHRDKFQRAMK